MDDFVGQDVLTKAFGSPLTQTPTDILGPLPEPGSSYSSWQDAANAIGITSPDARESSRPHIDRVDRTILGNAEPLAAQFDCLLCPYCKRPSLKEVHAFHVAECAQNPTSEASVKKEAAAKQQNKAEVKLEPPTPDKTPEVKIEKKDTEKPGKKRKAQPAGNGSETTKTVSEQGKKRARKERQPKQPRAKAPLNLDRQCGVPLPNGLTCMRSLTCKAHSMGAKRAVQGRSMPYDVLLANYQRQNQIKAGANPKSAESAEPEEPLNPEKEYQQIVEGMRKVHCIPLHRRVVMPTRMRTNNFRLREMLALALLPRGMSGTGDSLFGRTLAFRPENPSHLQYVRAPAVQRVMYLAALQQQQHQQRQQQQQQQRELPSQQRSQQPPRQS